MGGIEDMEDRVEGIFFGFMAFSLQVSKEDVIIFTYRQLTRPVHGHYCLKYGLQQGLRNEVNIIFNWSLLKPLQNQQCR